MDPDFLVFSGHKMLGPTGVGVLYIKKSTQPEVPPYQFGGGMVYEATYNKATWLQPPHCYEAGTPPIAQVIGLGAAIDYLNTVDFNELKKYEAELTKATIEGLQQLPGVRILGPVEQLKKEGYMVSFTLEGFHPHDIGAYLNQYNIAVRAGHYCAQPLANTLGITGSVRISFYLYNSMGDIKFLIDKLFKLVTLKE